MRSVDAAQIMYMARAATDVVGSQNPSDGDLLLQLNESFPEWYNLLAQAYSNDWAWNSYQFTTTLNQPNYQLPPDYFLCRWVDIQIAAGTPGQWAPVMRYDEALRGAYLYGAQLVEPGLVFRLSYTPTAPVLSQYATLLINSADGIDGILFQAVQAGTPGTNVTVTTLAPTGGSTIVTVSGGYNVTITPASGATNLQVVSTVNATPGASAVLVASVAGLGGDTFSTVQAKTALGTGQTLSFNFVNGLERYLVADCAGWITHRLDRDSSKFDAEKQRLEGIVRDLVETRDPGLPFVAPDNEMEQINAAPYWPTWNRRYGYTLQGNYINLLREGAW